MSGAIATAYVKLIPTFDKQLKSSIEKQLGGVDGKKTGSKVGKLFTKGVDSGMSGLKTSMTSRFSAATVAVGNIISDVAMRAAGEISGTLKDAFNNFADYEQLIGGVDTIFKESSSIVQKYAADAYKTSGMSANEYMQQVTSFSASLLQGLGGDTRTAASYADEAMRDMSDNANKFGTDMGRITDAYQGFAKQNYTMLDNLKLGYGGTKTEMERLLRDAEKIAGYTEGALDVSNFADVVEGIHIIQEEMGITGTTMEEAEHTISGSLRMLKSSWDNLLTGMFDDEANIGELFDRFASSFSAAASNVLPRIMVLVRRIVEGLPDAISTVLATLPDVIGPAFEEAFGEGIDNGLIAKLSEVGGKLSETLVPAIEKMQPGLEKAAQAISEFIEPIAEFASANGPAFESMMERVQGHIEDMGPIAEDLAMHFNSICEKLEPLAGPLGSAAADALGNLLSAIVGLGTIALGILDSLLELIDEIITAVQDAAEAVSGFVDGFLGGLNLLPPEMQEVIDQAGVVGSSIDAIPSEKTTTIRVDDQASGTLSGILGKMASIAQGVVAKIVSQEAAGGFYKLHASGGFITNGPTVLGRDAYGTVHIAGEAGREWIKKHADGTTSILPIENKRYLKPYAEEIAGMIGGSGQVTNYNLYIDGVRINDDAQIQAAMMDLFGTMRRKAVMLNG